MFIERETKTNNIKKYAHSFRLVVRTMPFQGRNMGSNPIRGTYLMSLFLKILRIV
jgi:hypothetical protein